MTSTSALAALSLITASWPIFSCCSPDEVLADPLLVFRYLSPFSSTVQVLPDHLRWTGVGNDHEENPAALLALLRFVVNGADSPDVCVLSLLWVATHRQEDGWRAQLTASHCTSARVVAPISLQVSDAGRPRPRVQPADQANCVL